MKFTYEINWNTIVLVCHQISFEKILHLVEAFSAQCPVRSIISVGLQTMIEVC
jgi:hypothetical protein